MMIMIIIIIIIIYGHSLTSYYFMLFHIYNICPSQPQPTKYSEACVKLRTYNAKDVFELLKSHDKELILNHYVQISKESTLQGAQEV